MSGGKDNSVYIEHMLMCIEKINQYTDGSKEKFFDSPLVQDAVIRNLQVLAESSQRISDDIKNIHTDIAWRDIVLVQRELDKRLFDIRDKPPFGDFILMSFLGIRKISRILCREREWLREAIPQLSFCRNFRQLSLAGCAPAEPASV